MSYGEQNVKIRHNILGITKKEHRSANHETRRNDLEIIKNNFGITKLENCLQ
jgi:hypothetical protein